MTYILCMCHMSCRMSCHMWGMASILSCFYLSFNNICHFEMHLKFFFCFHVKGVGLLIRLFHYCYFAKHGTHFGFRVSSFEFSIQSLRILHICCQQCHVWYRFNANAYLNCVYKYIVIYESLLILFLYLCLYIHTYIHKYWHNFLCIYIFHDIIII
jgi:hypothetical protein